MKRLLSYVLAIVMILSIAPVYATASENAAVPKTITSVADGDTRNSYTNIFNLDNTRYDGRIWTDKTVSTDSLTYMGNVHELGDNYEYENNNQVTVTKGPNEDFLVSYSALASTTTVLSDTNSPIDLVMVLDLSPMSNSEEGKLDSLLSAVQSAANHMMELNENNRVAIVAYSSQAQTLLPLGHYSSINMSRDTARPGQTTVVTCSFVQDGAAERNTFNVSYRNGTPVNKYTQMGIYAGMKILLDEKEISVNIGEGSTRVNRQPALILLSEGEPKLGSTNITSPTKSTVQTDGSIDTNGDTSLSSEYNSGQVFTDRVEIMRNNGIPDKNANKNDNRHAQTFATLLTAAYMKKAVSEHYFGPGAESMQVYTMGINTTTANSPRLAQIVLNPRIYLANGAPNSFSSTFIGYANSYFNNGSVSIPNAGNNETEFLYNGDELGLNETSDLMYNDGYYDVVGAGGNYDWDSVFDTVLSQVTRNTAKVPTLVDEDDTTGHNSGWLKYTDPIGEYMEVKDVKALIIDDVIYRTHSQPKDGEIDGVRAKIYTFSGTANNPVYGNHDISDIRIYVTNEGDHEEFHVDIPAALLPLRQTTVTENVNSEVISFTHNNAYPFRLVYSVGLKDTVLRDDGSVNMDVTSGGVSTEYISEHTVNGMVQFYEGLYSGEIEKGQVGNQNRTIGDAYVTYTPARNNPFYYVTDNTPLYVKSEDGTYTRASDGFDSNETYYFEISFYVATSADSGAAATKITQWISRPGSSIRASSVGDNNGLLYLKEGEPRLGNLNEFLQEKNNLNRTDTAQIYLYLYYIGNRDDDNVSSISDDFKVYHGNNGRLSVPLPDGMLSITKQVEGNANSSQEFTFEIKLEHTDDPAHDQNKITIDGVEFTNGVGEFSLKGNETKVFNIAQDHENGVNWTVQETTQYDDPDESENWSTDIRGGAETIDNGEKSASGTLQPGQSQAVTFINTYTTPTGVLTVAKVVKGDVNYADTSTFSFELKLSGLNGNTVTSGNDKIEPDSNGEATYSFNLATAQSRSFILPEGAKWTVTEKTGDLSSNWTVSNSYNPGGNSASGTIKQGDDDTVTFTNTYTSPGALVISKTVAGAESSDTYSFTIELKTASGVPVNQTIDNIVFNNGIATIELADGESKTIQHLPAGTTWTVTETSELLQGWNTTVNSENISTATGSIERASVSNAAFVNSAPGTLVVTKTVAGNDVPEGQEFSFTLTYESESQETFTLKNGESKRIDLPAGTKYTVTEDVSSLGAGWTVSVNGTDESTYTGSILAGQETVAAFTNTYTEPQEPPAEPEEPEYPRPTTPPNPDNNGNNEIEDVVPPMLNGDDHFAYIIGYEDGTVRPDGQITRAEVATVIFRLLKDEVRDGNLTTENNFTDVNEGDWYNTAVSTLVRLGIIEGRTATTFEPNAPITRAEFATLFARFDESGVTTENSFTDVSSHWAREYIERAAALGWINGYEDGTFRPDSLITRAEAMTMINRVLNREPKDENDLLPDMRVWSDNQPGAWYYLAVQEATNSHEYTRPNAPYEHWTEITADPNWERYQ